MKPAQRAHTTDQTKSLKGQLTLKQKGESTDILHHVGERFMHIIK